MKVTRNRRLRSSFLGGRPMPWNEEGDPPPGKGRGPEVAGLPRAILGTCLQCLVPGEAGGQIREL